MKLDLNSLLKEIYSWKTIVENKDEEIKVLQNQIKQANQCIETLEDSNNTLLQEISHFNNVVSTLQHSVSKLEEQEGEKKALIDERKQLRTCLNEQKEIHQKQITELREAAEQINATHREESKKKLSEIEAEASLKLESYSMKLREKENYILKLEDDISKLRNEKSQDILKMKLEYEEKINRMKSKIAKNKGSHHCEDFKKTDVFRQKYIEKEREAKEESLKLRKQIEDLQKEIESFKSAKTLTVSKHNGAVSHNISYSTEISTCLEEELHPIKRQKLIEDDSNDFVSLNITGKNLHKQSSIVHHFKKKLFNLDMNYFEK